VSGALHLLNYIVLESRKKKCRFWWLLASEVSHLPLFLESPKTVDLLRSRVGKGKFVFFTDFAWPKIFLESTPGVDLGRRVCAPVPLSSCHDSCCCSAAAALVLVLSLWPTIALPSPAFAAFRSFLSPSPFLFSSVHCCCQLNPVQTLSPNLALSLLLPSSLLFLLLRRCS